ESRRVPSASTGGGEAAAGGSAGGAGRSIHRSGPALRRDARARFEAAWMNLRASTRSRWGTTGVMLPGVVCTATFARPRARSIGPWAAPSDWILALGTMTERRVRRPRRMIVAAEVAVYLARARVEAAWMNLRASTRSRWGTTGVMLPGVVCTATFARPRARSIGPWAAPSDWILALGTMTERRVRRPRRMIVAAEVAVYPVRRHTSGSIRRARWGLVTKPPARPRPRNERSRSSRGSSTPRSGRMRDRRWVASSWVATGYSVGSPPSTLTPSPATVSVIRHQFFRRHSSGWVNWRACTLPGGTVRAVVDRSP